jgi:hypothetical protein
MIENIKSQNVRLGDIFIYGPFLMYAATKRTLTKTERMGLMALGVGTILYNWRNYKLIAAEAKTK